MRFSVASALRVGERLFEHGFSSWCSPPEQSSEATVLVLVALDLRVGERLFEHGFSSWWFAPGTEFRGYGAWLPRLCESGSRN